MSHNITIEGGTSVRLLTAGKYCDRDIVITATGGSGQPKKILRYIKFVVNEVRGGGTQMQFSEIDFLDADGNRFNYPSTTVVTSPDMPATASAAPPLVPLRADSNRTATKVDDDLLDLESLETLKERK